MSTRATIAYADRDDLRVHLYREMHDDCVHLELAGASHSEINVVIPDWMVVPLAKVIDPTLTQPNVRKDL